MASNMGPEHAGIASNVGKRQGSVASHVKQGGVASSTDKPGVASSTGQGGVSTNAKQGDLTTSNAKTGQKDVSNSTGHRASSIGTGEDSKASSTGQNGVASNADKKDTASPVETGQGDTTTNASQGVASDAASQGDTPSQARKGVTGTGDTGQGGRLTSSAAHGGVASGAWTEQRGWVPGVDAANTSAAEHDNPSWPQGQDYYANDAVLPDVNTLRYFFNLGVEYYKLTTSNHHQQQQLQHQHQQHQQQQHHQHRQQHQHHQRQQLHPPEVFTSNWPPAEPVVTCSAFTPVSQAPPFATPLPPRPARQQSKIPPGKDKGQQLHQTTPADKATPPTAKARPPNKASPLPCKAAPPRSQSTSTQSSTMSDQETDSLRASVDMSSDASDSGEEGHQVDDEVDGNAGWSVSSSGAEDTPPSSGMQNGVSYKVGKGKNRRKYYMYGTHKLIKPIKDIPPRFLALLTEMSAARLQCEGPPLFMQPYPSEMSVSDEPSSELSADAQCFYPSQQYEMAVVDSQGVPSTIHNHLPFSMMVPPPSVLQPPCTNKSATGCCSHGTAVTLLPPTGPPPLTSIPPPLPPVSGQPGPNPLLPPPSTVPSGPPGPGVLVSSVSLQCPTTAAPPPANSSDPLSRGCTQPAPGLGSVPRQGGPPPRGQAGDGTDHLTMDCKSVTSSQAHDSPKQSSVPSSPCNTLVTLPVASTSFPPPMAPPPIYASHSPLAGGYVSNGVPSTILYPPPSAGQSAVQTMTTKPMMYVWGPQGYSLPPPSSVFPHTVSSLPTYAQVLPCAPVGV